MAENLFEKARQSVSAVKEKISDFSVEVWGDEQKQLIEDWKEGGIAKVRETLESIGGSNALFIRSGYELKGVNVNLGIPPVIVSTFHFMKDISSEEREALLTEIKDSKIIHLLISCLLKARDFFEKIKVGDYKMTNVNITVGLTPGINVTFTRQDS